MKPSAGVIRPRNREERRAWWRAHVQAQLASGQTQIAYCRTQGLNLRGLRRWMRVFTIGDGRARRRELVSACDGPLDLVPVVVTAPHSRTQALGSDAESIGLQLTLTNGLSVSMQVGSVSAVARLVQELAEAMC